MGAESKQTAGVLVVGRVIDAAAFLGQSEHVALPVYVGGKDVIEVLAFADKESGRATEMGHTLLSLPVGAEVSIRVGVLPPREAGRDVSFVAREVVNG